LNIQFISSELRELCNSKVNLENRFDIKTANLLGRRLTQLAAAESLNEFSPEGSAPMKCSCDRNYSNLFKVPVGRDLNLTFTCDLTLASNDPNDWEKITSIKIEKIGSAKA